MASKSALKRLRTSKKKRARNKSRKTEIFTYEKKVHVALAEGGAEEVKALVQKACALVDKAAKCGTIHRNKANRKKSQMMKLLQNVKAKG
jgi:small subunit ribosomal protein S20